MNRITRSRVRVTQSPVVIVSIICLILLGMTRAGAFSETVNGAVTGIAYVTGQDFNPTDVAHWTCRGGVSTYGRNKYFTAGEYHVQHTYSGEVRWLDLAQDAAYDDHRNADMYFRVAIHYEGQTDGQHNPYWESAPEDQMSVTNYLPQRPSVNQTIFNSNPIDIHVTNANHYLDVFYQAWSSDTMDIDDSGTRSTAFNMTTTTP